MTQPIVHLYLRPEGGRTPVIACGTPVSHPRQYSDDFRKASCRKCAKAVLRIDRVWADDIWDHANERLDSEARSPWVVRERREKRKQEKEARRLEREAKKAAKAARSAA